MSDLPKGHNISAHKDEVGKTMHRWKHGKLHSGKGKKGKEGSIVKSQDQALAISLSLAGKGRSDHSEFFKSLGFSEKSYVIIKQLLQGSEKVET